MVNTADKGLRLVDISLVAIYFREKSLVGPSQVSRHAAVRTEPGMDRSWAWYRLRDRGFAQQTSPTPSGAPSEEDNLLRATKPKKVVCMCLDRFCGICGGIPKTTKALTAEPRYMTFEAQTFLLNKDTWLCTLTFGICGDMAPKALVPRIADTKIVLWGKNARIHGFLVPINRSTYFFNVVEVSGCFWTVPGQSGAELPIFICP